MDRPPTSKARGVCSFYGTARGCLAGDSCKFLHGDEKLTRFDQSKTCKFFAAGYCRRGNDCWFRHAEPPSMERTGRPEESSSGTDDDCSICLEKPITYGLLTECSHVFCIKCLRNWRDANGKSEDAISSGNTKRCPLCRASSRFVTPSSRFYPEGHPGKQRAIDTYKASMARVPCRYFKQSPADRRFCPFGKDCFYQHLNADGTPYVFTEGVEYYMQRFRSRRAQHFHGLEVIFNFDNFARPIGGGEASLEHLSHALEEIRASLPDVMTDTLIPEDLIAAALEEFDSDNDSAEASDDDNDNLPVLTARLMAGIGRLQESIAMLSPPSQDANLPEPGSTFILAGPSTQSAPSAVQSNPHASTASSSPPIPPADLYAPWLAPSSPWVRPVGTFGGSDEQAEWQELQALVRLGAARSLSSPTETRAGVDGVLSDTARPAFAAALSVSASGAGEQEGDDLQRSRSPRFSTVVGSGDRLVIDPGSEDDEEEQAESDLPDAEDNHEAATAPDADSDACVDHAAVVEDQDNVSLDGSDGSTPESAQAGPSNCTPLAWPEDGTGRKDIEFNADPPFATDGRGRVVWSNARHQHGRRRRQRHA